MNKKILSFIAIFALVLCSLPILKPLLDYGFFPIHDDMQFARVKEMADALREGQFPVRIVKNLGYGYHYPLYNFYAPLPYYLGAYLNLAGFDILWSTKLMIILPNILSVVTMFFLAYYLTENRLVSFLGGILYAYFPYRAADNYVRGTIGEIYVMMLLPILILGIYEIFSNSKFKIPHLQLPAAIAAGGQVNYKFIFSLAGIILSHNIYALIVCFYFGIFLFFLLLKRNFSRVLSFLVNLMISFGLTVFFWLPALFEAKYTHLDILKQKGYYFGNYFLNIKDLWQSDWGYGGAAGGMTFMIGKIHLVLFALILLIFIHDFLKKKKVDKLSLLPLFYFFLSILFTNKFSFLLWEKTPFLSFVQYPMRFIFFADFFLILFVVINFPRIKNKISLTFLIILIIPIVIFKNQSFFQSKYNYEFKKQMINEKEIRWHVSEMSDEYLPQQFKLPIKEKEIAKDEINSKQPIQAKILKHSADELILTLKVDKNNSLITFPVTNFIGWKIYANARSLPVFSDSKFFLTAAEFKKGNYLVKLKFEDTPIRTIANWISVFVLAGLISSYFYPIPIALENASFDFAHDCIE